MLIDPSGLLPGSFLVKNFGIGYWASSFSLMRAWAYVIMENTAEMMKIRMPRVAARL